MTTINLTVNGQARTLEADDDMPLLWALRDLLNLTGTKFGCGAGLCGACTVHVDGQAIRSCITTAASVAGRQITTIEGLSVDGTHLVQQAWLQENVSQCGYCQAGQIMTAVAFLQSNPNPTDDEIATTMAGNLCRCGTYQRILKAIHRATAGAGSS
jgi:isoquinoline 1-oxidoreductase subunit alpha